MEILLILIFEGIFLFPQLFVLCKLYIHFTYDKCPQQITVVGHETLTKISLNPGLNEWPISLEFGITMGNQKIVIYKPFGDILLKNNNRFILKRYGKHFTIKGKFTNEDSGTEIEYGYTLKNYDKFKMFCIAFISPDLTPFAILERLASPLNSVRAKSFYYEGAYVRIICKVRHLLPNGTFKVIFPKKAQIVVLENLHHVKSYLLLLHKNIRGLKIKCMVPNGYSATSSDFTTFVDLPIVIPNENRVHLAITISVIMCLSLVIFMTYGTYLLIYKLRMLRSKQIVKYRSDVSEIEGNHWDWLIGSNVRTFFPTSYSTST